MSWRSAAAVSGQAKRALGSLARAPMESQLPKVSTLESGILVGSIETYAPVSHVVVAVGAGPRHEKPYEMGAAHCVRAFSALSTMDASQFGISRILDAGGSNLATTSTREETVFHLQSTRDHLERGVSVLGQVSTHQAFKPWEVEDGHKRVKLELEYLKQDTGAQVGELAHEAAYRQGPLSRSLFCLPSNIHHMNNSLLLDFVDAHFTTDRIAILGLGVAHEDLTELVYEYFDASRTPPLTPLTQLPAKFYGGSDLRRDTGGSVVFASLVTEGARRGTKEAAALKVLSKILGGTPHSKYSSNLASSRLNAAVAKAIGADAFTTGFDAAYSDSGLFGLMLATGAKNSGAALKAAVSELSRLAAGDIADADVTRGKNQAKAEAMMNSECVTDVAKDLALGLLATRGIPDPLTQAFAVDDVSKTDVVEAATKLTTKAEKWAMAAIGGLGDTPYLDEIMG